MTLLFLCGGSYVSGMEVVEAAVLRGLAARGHSVHAVVSGWNDGDFIGRLRSAAIPHTVAYTGKISLRRPAWMADTLRHLPGARRAVRRIVRDFQPDLIVACNRDALVLLTGVFGRVPVVYHTHELLSPAWTSRVAHRAGRFVAVSEFVRGRLIADGVAADRVDVVLNGVERAAQITGRLQDGPPVVGICGQVGAWKGHHDLVDALALLAGRGVPFRFRVYGSGDATYVAEVHDRIGRNELVGHVEWMGVERDPDRMYAGLDVLAVPSRAEETFGMTLAEAGARGIPTVATRVGGIPEVVDDGETGLLVPPESPAALADALEALLTDPSRRAEMGGAARKRVEAHFLTEHMVDRFEAAVQSHQRRSESA